MKTISRVILSAIFLALTGLLIAAATYAPELVFSVYPTVSRRVITVLAGITAPFPFAVWEALVVVAILWVIYTLVRCFVRRRGFLNWLSGLVLGACVLVFAFVAIWGLGHFGPTVGEAIGLETRAYSQDELYDASAYYADLANEYAAQVSRDSDGVVRFSRFADLARQAPGGYQTLAQTYACFDGSDARVKRLTAGKLYSYFGTTGLFCPFTGESSVNPDTFEASVPYTMCHEIAHRMGFPAEDDSNFCAYLSCMASDSPEFRYSGAYSAFIYCYNALCEAAPERAGALWDRISEQVQTDCRAATSHYDQYEGKVQDAAQKVNDAYLKAFSEEAGVQSYGAVADYLIAWYQVQDAARAE